MATKLTALNLAAVKEAYTLIKPKIWKTPVYKSAILSHTISSAIFRKDNIGATGVPKINVFFKCENLQKTGSFKFRGASHFLARQNDRALRNGLVTYSTGRYYPHALFSQLVWYGLNLANGYMQGNHGIALAQAAAYESEERGFPIPLTVIMSKSADRGKISMIEKLGATVSACYSTMEACAVQAEELQRKAGLTLVPTSGHCHVVLGQGTVMLEFQQQVAGLGEKPLDAVIVPIAGGALLAGTALVCQEASSRIDVFGAEPLEGGPSLLQGRQRGRRIDTLCPEKSTIADGLRCLVAKSNWDILRSKTHVRDVFPVADGEILTAMRLILEGTKQLVEPSAAVPLAALLFNKRLHSNLALRNGPLNVGIILSGGNTSVERLLSLFT
ncbi:serine racemase [Trichophyton mentagrophytes]|uniref:Pyridoxal-5'-phosphate-dependent enzyme n=1 Tax=Trichophyton interdigitale TaxID=101480 RepID=A0A9P5D1Y3_9EURO|nr:Pyridoxal-5'-phosphate-dependent enzyme [Trichophyton interdigitale]KAF3901078.1 Pyridoxal-5'-phosphate-dependent enzyme [Trichophyton interdigitale]KAG8212068.1 Pyridoxal-5'-phosphate-dependent enzyme [Trichophyton interdigitale]GBF65670.1 serine racemase [Trichophyton mentagrophytes]